MRSPTCNMDQPGTSAASILPGSFALHSPERGLLKRRVTGWMRGRTRLLAVVIRPRPRFGIDACSKREKKPRKHRKTPINKEKPGITEHRQTLRVEARMVTWEYNTVLAGGGVSDRGYTA